MGPLTFSCSFDELKFAQKLRWEKDTCLFCGTSKIKARARVLTVVYHRTTSTYYSHNSIDSLLSLSNHMMFSRRLIVLVAALTASAGTGNAARLRNFELQREINLLEERIDTLEEQLKSGSATCTTDDECSGLPHCDNGYGNECYCELPMGVCDGWLKMTPAVASSRTWGVTEA